MVEIVVLPRLSQGMQRQILNARAFGIEWQRLRISPRSIVFVR